MPKATLGILFILAGLAYGSMANDHIYDLTLGYLVEHKWLIPPVFEKGDINPKILGRKPSILIYSGILILIGIYLLWNRNI